MFDTKTSKMSIVFKDQNKEYYDKVFNSLISFLKEEEKPRISEYFHLATLQTSTTSFNENTNHKQVLFEDENNNNYSIVTKRPISDYETFEYILKKVIPWMEKVDSENKPSIELVCNFIKFPLIYRNNKFTVAKTYYDLDLVKPNDQELIDEVNKLLD